MESNSIKLGQLMLIPVTCEISFSPIRQGLSVFGDQVVRYCLRSSGSACPKPKSCNRAEFTDYPRLYTVDNIYRPLATHDTTAPAYATLDAIVLNSKGPTLGCTATLGENEINVNMKGLSMSPRKYDATRSGDL